MSRHFETDPRDRPQSPRDSGRKPLIHASNRAERDAYREKVREVMQACGLTGAAVGALVDVDSRTVRRWLAGPRTDGALQTPFAVWFTLLMRAPQAPADAPVSP